MAAVEKLARSDPRLAAAVDQWDADPWLLNTPDGVVDLRTGQRRDHNPGDHIKMAAVGPDESCDIPTWRKFLSRVTDGNDELQKYLQRVWDTS